MVKLVQKSGYIKRGGAAAGYMKYIATRENVEKLQRNGPVTANQKKLIAQLLRDFPDTKELFEYEDYLATPTSSNASAFITMALDTNAHSMQATDGYMKYIATRPRVERHGEHGLFSDSDSVSLPAAIEELNGHDGRVWTFIYSLRLEDAARLGYDNAAQWQRLILSQKQKLAEAMRIPADQLHWYAAFHNESYHPHIHMMIWSDDPRQGYLSRDGIRTLRSALTNEIFKDELYALYKEKDISYREVTEKAQQVMRELITQMENAVCDSPAIAQMMAELSTELESVTGKKVYGYLKKPLKEKVDAVVDELAKLQPVADCYSVWNGLRDTLESYYKSKPREHLPLSQQKEFRAIKNMVIREAEDIRLGVHTFEDEDMQDEPENAQFNSERIGQFRDPSVLLAATRLLHHLANTFRDNAQPPANPAGLRIDSKRRRKLMQKRLAMGHKPDDHADPEMKQ